MASPAGPTTLPAMRRSSPLACLALLLVATTLPAMDGWNLYVSGYGPDIRRFALDVDGKLSETGHWPAAGKPSFLALSPNGRFLYAVSEVGEGQILAFAVADDGSLARINAASSGGKGPCHCSVHPSGQWVLVANYGSGHAAVLPVREDGGLGDPVCVVRPGDNAHMALGDPTGTFLFVPCKGSDLIAQYRFAATTGQLTPNDPPTVSVAAGAGPRHLAFAGDQAYLVNENASALTALSYDHSKGLLTVEKTASMLPEGFVGKNSGAHLVVDEPGGRVLASNRGHNSIACFSIQADPSLPTLMNHETLGDSLKVPRHFAITPDRAWLIVANQKGDSLSVQGLTEDRRAVSASYPCPGSPTCVLVVPPQSR